MRYFLVTLACLSSCLRRVAVAADVSVVNLVPAAQLRWHIVLDGWIENGDLAKVTAMLKKVDKLFNSKWEWSSLAELWSLRYCAD